ncbi:unnamed protein product [Heterosigma akashiwo]
MNCVGLAPKRAAMLLILLAATLMASAAFQVPRQTIGYREPPTQSTPEFRNRRGVVQLKSSVEESSSAEKTGQRQLVGADKFVRHNPMSDRFEVKNFHHVQFYCGDAQNTARRFQFGLGMRPVAHSDLATGNTESANVVLQSGDLRFLFTAPYALPEEEEERGGGAFPPASKAAAVARRPSPERETTQEPNAPSGFENVKEDTSNCFPGFDKKEAHSFFRKHGLAAKVGLKVQQ